MRFSIVYVKVYTKSKKLLKSVNIYIVEEILDDIIKHNIRSKAFKKGD